MSVLNKMGKDYMQIGGSTEVLAPKRLRFVAKKLINRRIRRKWREALKNTHHVKSLEDWWTDYD